MVFWECKRLHSLLFSELHLYGPQQGFWFINSYNPSFAFFLAFCGMDRFYTSYQIAHTRFHSMSNIPFSPPFQKKIICTDITSFSKYFKTSLTKYSCCQATSHKCFNMWMGILDQLFNRVRTHKLTIFNREVSEFAQTVMCSHMKAYNIYNSSFGSNCLKIFETSDWISFHASNRVNVLHFRLKQDYRP